MSKNGVKYKKPTWMSIDNWDSYMSTHSRSGRLYCHICGEYIHPSLHEPDHQIPSSHWGSRNGDLDQPSNLLPSHHTCNQRRSNGISPTWGKGFVFDDEVDLTKARTSQRDFLFNEIDRFSDWFSIPYGNINSRIISFFQIVGAGKTIGIGLLPYALNAAANKHYPNGAPRTRKMLVLCKDRALRSQLAKELSEELVQYGLVSRAPSVLELHSPGKQIGESLIQSADIVVACPHFLWDKNGEPSRHAGVLSRFELVCFDEVHWAYDQILMLLRSAKNKHQLLCGFTASPVRADGSTLDYMAKPKVYGYREATFFDQSMKGLYCSQSSLSNDGYDFDEMIDVVRANTFHDIHGNEVTLDLMGRQENSDMVAIESNISATLQRMYELDQANGSVEFEVSPHRVDLGRASLSVLPDKEPFWSHAIIRVSGQDKCEEVAKSINNFIGQKGHLSRNKGYHAVYANGSHELDIDSSPFFYAVRNDGRVSSKASRILVVDGLAKEGLNNKYVNINTWCRNVNSIVDACQCIGRAIRSTATKGDCDVIHAPRECHDRVHIIVHESHELQSVPTIKRALHFMSNMEAGTSEVMPLEEYFDRLSEIPPGSREDDAYLTPHEKRLLVIRCQEMLTKKGRIIPEDIAADFVPSGNAARIHCVSRFVVDLVHYDPTNPSEVRNLRSDLRLLEAVKPMSQIDMEFRDNDIDEDSLVQRCAVFSGQSISVVKSFAESDNGKLVLAGMYETISKSFESESGVVSAQCVRNAVELIAQSCTAQVQKYSPKRKSQVAFANVLKECVQAAVEKISESVQEVVSPEDVEPGGKFDKRCFGWQLSHDQDHRKNVAALVTQRLYEAGCFPKLSKFIGG